MSTRDDHPADERDLDATASHRLIAESQQRLRTGIEPDGRLLFGVWAVAWAVGYLVLWLSARGTGTSPDGVAFAVFGVLLLVAVVITLVHSVVRTAGTRGPSARSGALWGLGWPIGFATYGLIMGGVADAGASDEALGVLANALACLVVGLMYLGGGACFVDLRLYVLGVWIILVGAAATLAGMPATYLVMCLAGGGGFLVMTVVEIVLTARRRRGGGQRTAGTAVGQDER